MSGQTHGLAGVLLGHAVDLKQDPARLAALKARLDAGGLCTARDDLGRPCTLDSVQVELGVRPTLLYRPDGTEDWYPLPLELD